MNVRTHTGYSKYITIELTGTYASFKLSVSLSFIVPRHGMALEVIESVYSMAAGEWRRFFSSPVASNQVSAVVNILLSPAQLPIMPHFPEPSANMYIRIKYASLFTNSCHKQTPKPKRGRQH